MLISEEAIIGISKNKCSREPGAESEKTWRKNKHHAPTHREAYYYNNYYLLYIIINFIEIEDDHYAHQIIYIYNVQC
jgi:hypothetical protein